MKLALACFVVGSIPALGQQAYLKASNSPFGSQINFGGALALSGDTLAVAAFGEDSNATGIGGNQTNTSGPNSGAVYVFVRSGSSWVQQAYIKASNTGIDDLFGSSLALSGDTLVVGAEHEDSSATGVNGAQGSNSMSNAGAAYVFVRSGSTWTQQAYLKASNTAIEDRFGNAVAISGDTIVVSAVREDSNALGVNGNQADNSASYSGAAYVFVRNGTVWSQQAYLKASNTNADDKFGYALALQGDTLAVGAVGEDSNATGVNGIQSNNNKSSAGAVYVFTRSGTTWAQQAYVKASNTGSSDEFGATLALDGETLLVGALGENSNATGVNGNQLDNSVDSAGAAYVFVRNGSTWAQQAYLKASNTGSSDTFGSAVALDGDFAAIGAFREDSAATGVGGNQADETVPQAGAAYTFRRTGAAWAQEAYLKASNTEADDRFGAPLAVQGNTVVASALGEASSATGVGGNQSDNSVLNAGAVYVHETNACPPLAAAQTVRLGTPANPAAFLPAPGGGPVIGALWSPSIDHTSFAPAALFDIVALTALPAPVDVPTSFGTILCNLAGPVFTVTGPAGVPFAFAIPADCALVGSQLCTQGVAVSAAGIELANALDLVIGSL